jgi:hypothetical protein
MISVAIPDEFGVETKNVVVCSNLGGPSVHFYHDQTRTCSVPLPGMATTVRALNMK